MKKYIITGIIALLVGVGIGYVIHSPREIRVGAASPTGSFQSSPQIAQSSASPLTVAIASSTGAFLNNSNDRAVFEGYAFCTGVGSQPGVTNNAWLLYAATSTNSTPLATTSSVTNLINGLSIATSSATDYVATTTWSSDALRLWPSGTYLDFSFNGTNTATCTFGVKYIQL